MMLSYTGDLRVTQVVNGNKGIHLMVDKRYFQGKSLLDQLPGGEHLVVGRLEAREPHVRRRRWLDKLSTIFRPRQRR